MPNSLQAVVFADTIDIRFPFSGIILQVHKKAGDLVSLGQPLAQLDTKLLQTELDKELSDYEKIRAKFEIFDREHPNITDDILKFLKVIEQNNLTSSVKSVEIAKTRLDSARLICPINGLVISNGGCRSGLFATPASNSFTILDLDSTRLRVELDSAEKVFDTDNLSFTAEIKGEKITLSPSQIIPLGKKFIWDFYLDSKVKLSVGSTYSISITSSKN